MLPTASLSPLQLAYAPYSWPMLPTAGLCPLQLAYAPYS